MKLKEIIKVIEDFAPLALQEDYDNSGLIIGDVEAEINAALFCLDVTEAVIDEATDTGCNLIIAHHPIIFSSIKKVTGDTYSGRVIIKAIKTNISIYAAHTNLDNVRSGVNQKISEKLGLVNTRVLSPMNGKLMKLFTFVPDSHSAVMRQALFGAGAGSIGNYDECSFNTGGFGTFRGNEKTLPYAGSPGMQHRENETKIEVIFPVWKQRSIISALLKAHPYEEVAYDIVALENNWLESGSGMIGDLPVPMTAEEFLKHLKTHMNTAVVRYTKIDISTGDHFIKKIAVCGGSGSFLLKNAIVAGANAFVSADFKYHQFFDHENRIMICDIGHYESEQFTPEIFARILQRKFPTFAARFTTVITNPINYY